MKPTQSLLALALALAAGLSACASTSSVAHQASLAGPAFQEQPETLAHWKVVAERMAAQAAPHLAHIVVSPHASGVDSAFDVGFHDFFVSALHAQGVAERTDAELLEALRQALTDVRRQPTRKPPKQRTAHMLAEFARRYPCGSDQNPKDSHPVSTPETEMSSNTYRRS